ncbi:MAG: hypothetical protein AAB535_02485 [Patescibacteria group bacterium]
MNLKDFFAQKEKPPETYWSLVLEPGWVQAGIWHITDSVAQVITSSPATPWEANDELIGAIDTALSSAVQKLPEGASEPTKTVFGVSSNWIKDGEIGSEYLEKIKKVCEDLSLTPTGFVVLPEAIAHYYKSIEGVPINSIILGLGKNFLEVSVFSLGNLVGTSSVARSVSLADDVVEGLSRFEGASPLPSRIIIFNGRGGELEEARDTLSGVAWDQNTKIQFLHTPKVEILESDKKVLATSLAGAAEIGQASAISNVSEVSATTSLANLGFSVGKDVSEEVLPPPPSPVVQKPELYLTKLKSFFTGKKFTPLIVIFGVFIFGLIFFWWFYPKATVSIYVSPQKFEEEFDISFDVNEINKVSVSGEKTKSATGTKLIGEKAKGVVSLRNGTDSPINFPASTVLVSSGDLRFSLNETASVSAAIDADNPGTAGANVTALDLGSAYNLAKDEVFKVGNYPKADAYAKSTLDFSGGSSREISAVNIEDREKLLNELTNELSDKARGEFLVKTNNDQVFVNSFAVFEIDKQSFSHKIGDEADTLKLDLSMIATGVITNKQRLADFVREKLKDKIPQGFVLRDTQVDYKFEFIDADGEKYNYKMTTTVNFLPEIKTEEIIKKITGKLPQLVEEYLSSTPGFSRAEIRVTPLLFGKFATLPRVAKNITIEVVAEK